MRETSDVMTWQYQQLLRHCDAVEGWGQEGHSGPFAECPHPECKAAQPNNDAEDDGA